LEKVIIFDLDGTIVTEPEFYKNVYSGTLNEVVGKERGKTGLDMLQYCRREFDGKGELALFALNIPYRKWADKLINAPLDLIPELPEVVWKLKSIAAKKVIYTGSPIKMALRMLDKIGFSKEDFDFICGWKEPEIFPVKWTCSSMPFRYILRKFKADPRKSWSVGDEWETDLKPAQVIAINTAEVRKHNGNPTIRVPTLQAFLDHLEGEKGGD